MDRYSHQGYLPNVSQLAYSGESTNISKEHDHSLLPPPIRFTQSQNSHHLGGSYGTPYNSQTIRSQTEFLPALRSQVHPQDQPLSGRTWQGARYEPSASAPHLQAMYSQRDFDTNMYQNCHEGTSPTPTTQPHHSLSAAQSDSTSFHNTPTTLPPLSISAAQSDAISIQNTHSRGRPEGQGRTRATNPGTNTINSQPIATANSQNEATPSLKILLDKFLPKSVAAILPENSKSVPLDLAEEIKELLEKVVSHEISASEMRVVAKKYSKKKFSQADGAFFMALEEDMEIIRAIYYLIKRVSPEQAARHIGEFKAMRDATLWNGFQASPEGQKVYRECGGITGQAHRILSMMWDEKTAEQKLTYRMHVRKTKTVKSVLFAGLNNTDGPQENLSQEAITSRCDLDSTGDANLLASSRSLANAHEAAEIWVAETQVQANRVAKFTNSNIVILCSSSHLGPHSFQMFGGSPRGLSWMKLHQERYGVANCNSELQSFCTGVAVGKLNIPGAKARKSRVNTKRDKCREALKELLKKTFPDKDYSWPWTNCEGKLKSWGAKIVLHPGAQTTLNYVTQLSKNLTDEQGDVISMDIKKGLFHLLEIPKDASDLKPRAPKKRKRRNIEDRDSDDDDDDENEDEDEEIGEEEAGGRDENEDGEVHGET